MFDSLLKSFNDNPHLWLGVIFTFALGLFNLWNTYRIHKRTTFINTVTSERIKWIQNVRKSISEFCGLTHSFDKTKLTDEQKNDILKQVDKLRYLIPLQLNPHAKTVEETEIENLLKEIPDLIGKDTLLPTIEKLIKTSQSLLKNEWEKVKREAEQGRLDDNKNTWKDKLCLWLKCEK